VARAKRTDRAEARRQYRAYLASQQEPEAADAAEGAAEESQTRSAASRRPSQQAPAAPRPGERMGLLQAVRNATRPYGLRSLAGDVRDIGWLITRTRAVWPIAALCLAAAAVSFPMIHSNLDVSSNPLLGIVFQFVLYPMPLLPPMLAGFLAPRATWLAGALAAAISVGFFIFMVAATPVATVPTSALASASPSTAAGASASVAPSAAATAVASVAPSATPTSAISTVELISGSDLPGASFQWLFTAIPFGALIGAGAGWYRRFLDNLGPRGGAPRKPQQQKRTVRKQPVRR